MDAVLPAMHAVVSKHGLGIVHAVLHGFSLAHVVNVESTAPGVFCKAHFPGQNPKSDLGESGVPTKSTRTSSIGSSPRQRFSREDLLRVRPPRSAEQVGVENTFVQVEPIGSQNLVSATTSQSAPSTIGTRSRSAFPTEKDFKNAEDVSRIDISTPRRLHESNAHSDHDEHKDGQKFVDLAHGNWEALASTSKVDVGDVVIISNSSSVADAIAPTIDPGEGDGSNDATLNEIFRVLEDAFYKATGTGQVARVAEAGEQEFSTQKGYAATVFHSQ